jgi:F0F1-type ATP synthase assembly protein I
VLNTVAAGRRLARRLLIVQIGVIGLVALALTAISGRAALGALTGGMAVAIGSALMAWRVFSGPVAGAGVTLMRMAGGLALKWLVIVLMLYLALVPLALEPLAVFGGVLAALGINLAALIFKS